MAADSKKRNISKTGNMLVSDRPTKISISDSENTVEMPNIAEVKKAKRPETGGAPLAMLEANLKSAIKNRNMDVLKKKIKEFVLQNNISLETLLEYVKKELDQEENGTYPIPFTIISLGEDLCKEKNPILKKLGIELWELAVSYCKNLTIVAEGAEKFFYGKNNFPKDLDKALQYAQQASANNREMYFIQAEVLRQKEQYAEAIQAYLKYIGSAQSSDAGARRAKVEKAAEEMLELWCGPKEEITAVSQKLTPLFLEQEVVNFYNFFSDSAPKHKYHYIRGLVFYQRQNYREAMLSFIEIPKSDPHYKLTAHMKKDCYLQTARAILYPPAREEKERAVKIEAINSSNGAVVEDAEAASLRRLAEVACRYFDPTKAKNKEAVFEFYIKLLDARFGESPRARSAAASPGPALAPVASLAQEEKVPKEVTPEAARAPAKNSATATASSSSASLVRQIAEEKISKGVIPLFGRNARQVYRAEFLFQRVAKQLLDDGTRSYGEMDLGIPYGHPKDKAEYGPSEYWQIGEHKTEVWHVLKPKRERLGNSYVNFSGKSAYDDLYPVLKEITKGDSKKEKLLATRIIQYANDFTPITAEELQKIKAGPITEEIVRKFHAFCLLVTVKEQTQWLSSPTELYQAGIVAQARCFILLEQGHLRFAQVFKNGASYGVFSQQKLLWSSGQEKVKEAIKKIEVLYTRHNPLPPPPVRIEPSAAFFAQERALRRQARLDLRKTSGGAESEDSSDEDIMEVKATVSEHKDEKEGKMSDGEINRSTQSSSSNSSSSSAASRSLGENLGSSLSTITLTSNSAAAAVDDVAENTEVVLSLVESPKR